MVLTGSLPPMRGLFLFPAEILGGIVAAALVSCMFPGDISVVNTTLASNTSIVRGVFIEMFLTSLLLFVIHMLAAEKSKATFIAPIGIGLALFVAELAGVQELGTLCRQHDFPYLPLDLLGRSFPGQFGHGGLFPIRQVVEL